MLFSKVAQLLLLFADQNLSDRISAFDESVDTANLVYGPVSIGLVLAIALPWIRLAGAIIVERPTTLLRQKQQLNAQKERISRIDLDTEEALAKPSLLEAEEQAKIDAASRLEEAKQVGPKIADELQTNRAASEDFSDLPKVTVDSIALNTMERKLLGFAAESSMGRFYLRGVGELMIMNHNNEEHRVIRLVESHRQTIELDAALSRLVNINALKLLPMENGVEHEITKFGYDLIDDYEIPF